VEASGGFDIQALVPAAGLQGVVELDVNLGEDQIVGLEARECVFGESLLVGGPWC
jgi:hypothetical protein